METFLVPLLVTLLAGACVGVVEQPDLPRKRHIDRYIAEPGDSAKSIICSYLATNCHYLRSTNSIPYSRQLSSGEPTVELSMTVEPIKLIGLYDMSQSFAMKVDIKASWLLPACAIWKGLNTFGETAGDTVNNALVTAAPPVSECSFPKKNMYHPLLLHANSMKDAYTIEKSGAGYISVDWFGRAEMQNKNRLDSSCSFDFSVFPFDEQTCHIEISPFGDYLHVSQTKIVSADAGRSLVYDGDIWNLVDNRSYTLKDGASTNAAFEFTFRRKPEYCMLMVITPIALLSALQLASFLMPAKNPDRATYSITVVLAFSVQSSAFSAALPRTSKPIYLFYYIIANMCTGGAITIYSLFMSRLARIAAFRSDETWRKSCFTRIAALDLLCAMCAVFAVLMINLVAFSAYVRSR